MRILIDTDKDLDSNTFDLILKHKSFELIGKNRIEFLKQLKQIMIDNNKLYTIHPNWN